MSFPRQDPHPPRCRSAPSPAMQERGYNAFSTKLLSRTAGEGDQAQRAWWVSFSSFLFSFFLLSCSTLSAFSSCLPLSTAGGSRYSRYRIAGRRRRRRRGSCGCRVGRRCLSFPELAAVSGSGLAGEFAALCSRAPISAVRDQAGVGSFGVALVGAVGASACHSGSLSISCSIRSASSLSGWRFARAARLLASHLGSARRRWLDWAVRSSSCARVTSAASCCCSAGRGLARCVFSGTSLRVALIADTGGGAQRRER